MTCERANEEFIRYIVAAAELYPDDQIIVCLKETDSFSLNWFSVRIGEVPNIAIVDHSFPRSSYTYCKYADVVVSLQSSMVEECIGFGKRVVLIDDLFCVNNVCSGIYPTDFQFMIVASVVSFEDRLRALFDGDISLEEQYTLLRKNITACDVVAANQTVPTILDYGLSLWGLMPLDLNIFLASS